MTLILPLMMSALAASTRFFISGVTSLALFSSSATSTPPSFRPNEATPGVTALGLAEAGVDYALDEHNAKLVSADMKKKVDAAKADIIGGKIKVIDYMTASACK